MHGTDTSLNRLAFSATTHCLTGCAIGEVLGVVIGTAPGWGNFATIALAIVLAFFFGHALTMPPLLRSGLALGAVLPLAFASDTLSMTVMEIVDNLIILAVPGAMEAGLASLLFWGTLAFALAVAFVADFPGQLVPDLTRQGPRGGAPVPPWSPRAQRESPRAQRELRLTNLRASTENPISGARSMLYSP
jgi:TctA family transporter